MLAAPVFAPDLRTREALLGHGGLGEVFERAPYPAWTALGVNWLAGFDFEIKVIARIPKDG